MILTGSELADARAFRTWLYRLTRHRAIDFLRRRRRAQELFVDEPALAAIAEADPDSGEASDTAPAETVLARLPALQREVILLRFRDELSYAEIAAIAGCSVGTVRSRLFYARRRLAELATTTFPGEG